MTTRPRAREVGLLLGDLPTGRFNAITDVAGVLVGQTTLIAGDGPLVPGQGPVRTGVTAIRPHGGRLWRNPVPAAVEVINGAGSYLGLEEIREYGLLASPVLLTSTLNVGRVADALVTWMIRQDPEYDASQHYYNPVVGECHDAYLNDVRGRHVREEHVLAALDGAASGPVAEGTVGAGTGTSCFGFKGGIGTASRVVALNGGAFTVGALVQTNFGRPGELVIAGVPVGKELRSPDSPGAEAGREPRPDGGSIMIVLATDAPATSRQLGRLARRVELALGRVGSLVHHGSGDVVIAFSTARLTERSTEAVEARLALVESGPAMGRFFQAVVEATEEAIVNSLFRATTVRGRDGNVSQALPIETTVAILRRAGRLA